MVWQAQHLRNGSGHWLIACFQAGSMMIHALQTVHAAGIVHRDIKPGMHCCDLATSAATLILMNARQELSDSVLVHRAH